MKESDLYLPVKHYLESQGYDVKGEVNECDAVAVRGDETPVIVELKLSLNLDLMLQAVNRLAITPNVYIGVPTRNRLLAKRRKSALKMLKMLGIGLLVIDPENDRVDALLDPSEYRPRVSKRRQQRLLAEFQARVGDPNLGGRTKRKGLMTAYRQRAILIATYLRQHGPTKAAAIAEALNEPKARAILYRNVYGWFDRPSRGIYSLTPTGQRDLIQWQGPSQQAPTSDP